MKYEWDEAKNLVNIRKHGIDFRDAAYVFADPFSLSIPDDEYSDGRASLLYGSCQKTRCFNQCSRGFTFFRR